MIEDLLQVTFWTMREVQRWYSESQVTGAFDCMVCWSVVAADCRQSHLEWHQKSRV
jgi:hypothetical protein